MPKPMLTNADIQPIAGVIRRKSTIILANKGFSASAVAAFVGCCISTVFRSLKRLADTGDVADSPRCGRPAAYSETFKLELIGFYCQTQPLPGSGQWTLRWAAAHLAAHPEIVNATPCKSTIHRILAENNLKPHQSRYFLHITDPDFFPKMYHLLDLFSNAPKNLFFFDECPGIQILKRLVPCLRTDQMQKRLEEFEYIRNGTMDVFAFFKYDTGAVYAECRADHKTDTFLEIFSAHVASCPKTEELHYVMDNLSTHRGYPFCKAVAELSGVDCPPEKKLKNLAKRVEWLTSTNKRIVIHYTPYHGSWLNLVEFWFGIMNKKVLNESYGAAEELKKSFGAFLEEWNTLLAHPFKWSYDGNGLEAKAVERFVKILNQSANKLEISTLSKQLELIFNVFSDCFLKVKTARWDKLFDTLKSREETLRNIIKNENGPKRKERAETALNSLMSILENYTFGKIQKAA